MTNNKQRPGIGIGVIVCKDNKILFGRRLKNRGNGTWQFPGGRIEHGESFEETAVRETKEETNINIKNPRFVAITNNLYPDGWHGVTLFMLAEYDSGELKNMEPDKAEKWGWYSWDQMPKPLFLPIEHLLEQGYNPFENNENK